MHRHGEEALSPEQAAGSSWPRAQATEGPPKHGLSPTKAAYAAAAEAATVG